MYAGAKTNVIAAAPVHEEEGMGLYDEPAFDSKVIQKNNPLFSSNENIADVSNQDDLYNEPMDYTDTAAFDMTQADYNEIDGADDDGTMDVGYLDVDANELAEQPLLDSIESPSIIHTNNLITATVMTIRSKMNLQ